MTQPQDSPFTRLAAFDQQELVGARWWHEALRTAPAGAAQTASGPQPRGRRALLKFLGITAGSVGLIATCNAMLGNCDSGDEPPGPERGALELQREQGWDVGATERELVWEGAAPADADGASGWIAAVQTLDHTLAPARAGLRPYYVPTLFQAPKHPLNRRLVAGMRPIHTPAMDRAYARGVSLATLFGPEVTDVGLIIDLPGPSAVAYAAGLLPRFDPIFLFDNWPHPRGVVPAHLTLGAALTYCGRFRSAERTATALPAFILDGNRLLPYIDNAAQFDNRHLARVPSVESLRVQGLRHLLYVRGDEAELRELDDLNDLLCGCDQRGVDVKGVVLQDFAEGSDGDSADVDAGGGRGGRRCYYGGSSRTHFSFWTNYGWHAPLAAGRAANASGVSTAYRYTPTRRTTIFSGGSPQPVGRVYAGTRSGRTLVIGRSGTLGRVGGGSRGFFSGGG